MDEIHPRKVLMTTDTVGGVWTFSLDLARALTGSGIEVALATLGGLPSDSQLLEVRAIPGVTLFESSYKLEWMADPWSDVEESGRWLMRLAQQLQPDVIHLNSFGHGQLSWRVPVVLTAHSCVLSWWWEVKGEPAPEEWNPYRDFVAQSLQSVDLIITPSHAMATSLRKDYACSTETRVIPNGRPALFNRPEEKKPFVITAGRLWDEAKNTAAVAQVAQHLAWPVYAAGDTAASGSRAAQLPGIHLLGRLASAELAQWFARAAIFVSPARYEPFGLAALEAGLSRCALVLGDIPSLREVWDDAALFVKPDDHRGLQRTIHALIDDHALREEMSHRSYQRALLYDIQTTARNYLESYRRVMASRGLLCAS